MTETERAEFVALATALRDMANTRNTEAEVATEDAVKYRFLGRVEAYNNAAHWIERILKSR